MTNTTGEQTHGGSEYSRLRAAVASFEQKHLAVGSELTALQAEYTVAQTTISALQNQLDNATSSLSAMQTELNKANSTIDSLTATNESLKSQIQTAQEAQVNESAAQTPSTQGESDGHQS